MGAGLFPLLFPLNDNKIGGISLKNNCKIIVKYNIFNQILCLVRKEC
mgnify:CR=1 FL=1